MTAIEIIALIVVVLSLVKIVALALAPQAWNSKKNPLMALFWGSGTLSYVAPLMLAGVVLYYLLAYFSITEIFAASMFSWAFFILVFAPYRSSLMRMMDEIVAEGDFIKKNWVTITAWLLLVAWVLCDMFVK